MGQRSPGGRPGWMGDGFGFGYTDQGGSGEVEVKEGDTEMGTTLTAVELNGTVDEHSRLQLDAPLPFPGPRRVRVIMLYAAEKAANEAEWLHAAARNPAVEDLGSPAEDIYTREDGKPRQPF